MKRSYFFISILFVTAIFLVSLNLNAGDSYRLNYKMKKGQTLNYSVVSTIESLQEMMGSEMESQIESKARTKLTSEGSDKEGNLTYLLVYESLVVDFSSAMLDSTFENPGGLIGKRVRKTITPTGDQIESVEVDTIKLGMLAQGGALASGREFLPNLPNEEIKMGGSVSLTDVDSVEVLGGTTVSKSEVEFTLIGKESRSGYDCLKIGVKGTLSLEGEGSMQGMKFFLEGDGDIQRTLYFAPKEGVLVSSEDQTDIEMTIAITGQMNMTIPSTQSTKSSITLVK